MEKTIKRTLFFGALGLWLLVLLIVINQISQLALVTSAIHPGFSRVVTLLLSLFFLMLFLWPVLGFWRLRKPLDLPEPGDEAGYQTYLNKLRARLIGNGALQDQEGLFQEDQPLEAQVEGALSILDQEANRIIFEGASTVFVTTAVSQNGMLDGVFVLTSLSKMVWKISRLYNQRPSLHETLSLYANVAATVLMARELEDLALLDEQLEPVIDALIGGTISTMIPGASVVANLLVDSVLEGSANAFLTLRVGAMTRQYCGATTKLERRKIKRLATIEACRLLGQVVQQNAVSIVKAFASASKKATVDRTFEKIKDGAHKTGDFVKDLFKR